MQLKSLLLIPGIIIYSCSFGQASKRDEINFSDPFQIDSTEYFLIPRLIDNDNKDAYGKGKGYLPLGHYSDIHFYNSKQNQIKKIFSGTRALVLPFDSRGYYYDKPGYGKPGEASANILPGHIIYLARTENYNGDNGLDTDDPVYLYISTKTGDNLAQITPKGLNVVSWTCSKDKKIILVKLQQDTNGNKKFGTGDNEVYYRIDLDGDIAKIKCYPIAI